MPCDYTLLASKVENLYQEFSVPPAKYRDGHWMLEFREVNNAWNNPNLRYRASPVFSRCPVLSRFLPGRGVTISGRRGVPARRQPRHRTAAARAPHRAARGLCARASVSAPRQGCRALESSTVPVPMRLGFFHRTSPRRPASVMNIFVFLPASAARVHPTAIMATRRCPDKMPGTCFRPTGVHGFAMEMSWSADLLREEIAQTVASSDESRDEIR